MLTVKQRDPIYFVLHVSEALNSFDVSEDIHNKNVDEERHLCSPCYSGLDMAQ